MTKDLIQSYWTQGTAEQESPVGDYWSTAPNAEVSERTTEEQEDA